MRALMVAPETFSNSEMLIELLHMPGAVDFFNPDVPVEVSRV